ncbi:MAG: hydroxymethylbilane synthase [bacterium]|nr:hydroxymethylbilane synthase [bacterium]
MRFRIGTRGSKLALKQTEIFIREFKARFPDTEFEIVVIKTKGDKILDAPFSKIPHKGLFVKDIEDELIRGNIDFAVHSLKDVPLDIPESLCLSAFLTRENPSDIIVGMNFQQIKQRLQQGSKIIIGTSSLRREFLLREKFKEGNLDFAQIRGNVDTRINKVRSGQYDCIVLALAGVLRLGLEELLKDIPYEILDPKDFLYSPGQGIIVVETREGTKAYDLSRYINDERSEFLGELEREILRKLGGGCSLPLGVCTDISDGKLFVKFRLFGDASRSVSYEGLLDLDYSIKAKHIVDSIFSKIKV